MGLVTVWWEQHHQGTQGKLFAMGLLERVLVASHAVWFYSGKLVWPANLTFSYPRWTINPTEPLAYGWLVAGAGLGGAIYFARRFVGRGVEVAALFYVATLSPLLGFIMLYTFRYTFVADHYQYVASIGPLALAAAGISLALGRFEKRSPFLKPVFCGVLLLVLGVLTWRQSGMYVNAETLWRTTIARNPGSSMAHNNLGNYLYKEGRIEEAMEHYHNAIQINPNDAEVQNNLGVALAAQGRFDEAIENYRKAIQINPDYAEAQNNLGATLADKGRFDEAIENFRKAIQINPDYISAQYNLAWLLAASPDDKLRNGAEAVRLAERACELTHYGEPLFIETLAAAYAEAGRFPDAMTTAQKALVLATAQANTAVADDLRMQIRCYEKGAPFRDNSLTNTQTTTQ
jgi:tetratricopeptide (TPR) repeat protein